MKQVTKALALASWRFANFESLDLLGYPTFTGLHIRIIHVGARTLLGAKGIATSNKCLTSSNKKLVETRS